MAAEDDAISGCPGGDGAGGAGEGLQCGREPLEDVEMDAALALADFAQMALLERERAGGADGGGAGGREEEWRGTEDSERWPSKRTRSASVAGPVGEKSLLEEALLLPHHQQTKEAEDHRQKEGGQCGADGKMDSGSGSAVCKAGNRYSHRRGKQSFSEAEKEKRRLRRVLANRESARQTILKRKALCEELTRKAAELSLENENMKTERDEIMKEYLSLRDRNMELKEQVAEGSAIKCEVKEDPPCTTSWQTESLASSSPVPVVPPFLQFSLSLSLKPSDSVHSGSRGACIYQEQGVCDLPRPGFLVAQCPWFWPTSYQPAPRSVYNTGGEGHSSVGEHPMVRMRDLASSSRIEDFAEGENSSKCMEAVSKETEDATVDTNVPKPSRTAAAQTSEAQGGAPFPSCPPGGGNELGAVTPLVELQGSLQHPRRKVVQSSAAAEARRRRKELTKLRHLHAWRGRACR